MNNNLIKHFLLKWMPVKDFHLQVYDHARLIMKTGSHSCDPVIRGSEQIRTAVKGFADLCLATRPRNRIFFVPAKVLPTSVYPPAGGHGTICISYAPEPDFESDAYGFLKIAGFVQGSQK
jgi:hypothetical protein